MLRMGMADGVSISGYGARRRSPLGLGGTVAVHALLVGAFLLMPRESILTVFNPPPLVTKNVPLDSPPPEPVPPARVDPRIETQPQVQRPTAADPVVPLPAGDPVIVGGDSSGLSVDPQPVIAQPPFVPPLPPVLVDASIDPRAASTFQPDYPGAMIRQGAEGSVTVRVEINAAGRVTAVERISATDESFWLATQRHALHKWRFRPATRDGVAVASSKVLTVRFTLTDR